jgi:hypothetical protein
LSFIAIAPNRLTPVGELGVTRRDGPGDYRCTREPLDAADPLSR